MTMRPSVAPAIFVTLLLAACGVKQETATKDERTNVASDAAPSNTSDAETAAGSSGSSIPVTKDKILEDLGKGDPVCTLTLLQRSGAQGSVQMQVGGAIDTIAFNGAPVDDVRVPFDVDLSSEVTSVTGEVAGAAGRNTCRLEIDSQTVEGVTSISCSLSASVVSLMAGTELALDIALADGASGMTLSGGTFDTEALGVDTKQVTDRPTSSTTYTLTVSGSGSTTTCSKSVVVTQPPNVPVINSFAINGAQAVSASLKSGDAMVFTWDSSNVDRCDLMAGATLLVSGAAKDRFTLEAEDSATFSLACYKEDTRLDANPINVSVEVVPRIVSYTVFGKEEDYVETADRMAVFKWKVVGVTSCKFNGNWALTKGEYSLRLDSPTYVSMLYKLECVPKTGGPLLTRTKTIKFAGYLFAGSSCLLENSNPSYPTEHQNGSVMKGTRVAVFLRAGYAKCTVTGGGLSTSYNSLTSNTTKTFTSAPITADTTITVDCSPVDLPGVHVVNNHEIKVVHDQPPPDVGAWENLSSANAPTGRLFSYSVWTGTDLLVYGGHDVVFDYASSMVMSSWKDDRLSTSGRFKLAGEDGKKWSPMASTSFGKDGTGTSLANVVWTGKKMMVLGGNIVSSTFIYTTTQPIIGKMYDPAKNSWDNIPKPDFPFKNRMSAFAAWSGTELVYWGGVAYEGDDGFGPGPGWPNYYKDDICQNDGAIYNPSDGPTGKWRRMTRDGTPPPLDGWWCTNPADGPFHWDDEERHQAIVVDGKFWLYDDRAVYSYDLTRNTWARIPVPDSMILYPDYTSTNGSLVNSTSEVIVIPRVLGVSGSAAMFAYPQHMAVLDTKTNAWTVKAVYGSRQTPMVDEEDTICRDTKANANYIFCARDQNQILYIDRRTGLTYYSGRGTVPYSGDSYPGLGTAVFTDTQMIRFGASIYKPDTTEMLQHTEVWTLPTK